MKVILTQDIKGIGKKYEVKDLADGYARNFVIQRGLGEVATQESLARVEKLKAQRAMEDEMHNKKLDEIVRILKDRHLEFSLKTGENGSVFGSVSRDMISKELRHVGWCSEEHVEVKMDHPIKSTGEHKVTVSLPKGRTAELKINVRSQP